MPKRTRDGQHRYRDLDMLTAREREVAILVAAGWSNAQIAARLILAENTIKLHVRHVLDKVGISTRAGLCAYALRQGLFALTDIPLDIEPPEPNPRYIHHQEPHHDHAALP